VINSFSLFLSSAPSSSPLIFSLFPYTTLFRSLLRLFSGNPGKDFRRNQYGMNALEIVFGIVLMLFAIAIIIVVLIPKRSFRIDRSEEHTSELQSRFDLVCRLLLEKKKDKRRDK